MLYTGCLILDADDLGGLFGLFRMKTHLPSLPGVRLGRLSFCGTMTAQRSAAALPLHAAHRHNDALGAICKLRRHIFIAADKQK